MTTVIDQLKSEYSGGVMYGIDMFSMYSSKSTENTGFMGSKNVVFLNSLGSIVLDAPGCVAAPLVNMVAKETISLGIAGQGSHPIPARLYAPSQLTITTKHLLIGDLMLLINPEHGAVSCKKLTVIKKEEIDPDCFEIIRSLVINDDTEIEKVKK